MTIQAAGPAPDNSSQEKVNAPPVIEARTRAGSDLFRAVARNKKALTGVLLLLFFLVLAVFGAVTPALVQHFPSLM